MRKLIIIISFLTLFVLTSCLNNPKQVEYIMETQSVTLTEDLPMVDSIYIKENINTEQLVHGDVVLTDEMSNAFKSKEIKINDENYFDQSSTIWISEWLTSDNGTSAYGKGRFYYRFARSRYYNKRGNYKYEVYFISDSYYNAGMYNGAVYRSATKINEVRLLVDGHPYINDITGSGIFWIMFQGNYEQGIGDLRISFYNSNPNASVYITWSAPRPF
tara:strand:+ start:2411 stop:3061 length:651 start_codon:yes stop_codon:yes gene_type:complete